MPERDAARLLRLVTDEIWNRRRYELVDELIADDSSTTWRSPDSKRAAGLGTWHPLASFTTGSLTITKRSS